MMDKGVQEDKCIACGLCMMVCPFGAVNVEDKKAQKCSQCDGREDGPGCIKACSKRALALLDVDIIKNKKQEEYLSKLSGISKKPKKASSMLNIVTSTTRASKTFKD